MENKDKNLIWDLPTRLFHWVFVAGFVTAALIALTSDDESVLFPYHAILGLTLAFTVLLRLIWGFAGTRYARFSSFVFSTATIIKYFKTTLFNGGSRYTGHNPGSALVIFVMLFVFSGLVVSGILLGQGEKQIKELHELLAFVMIFLVIVHLTGLLIHTLQHRENISMTMVHGMKHVPAAENIQSSRMLVGLIFLVLTGLLIIGLFKNYNSANHSLHIPVVNIHLQFGEPEHARPEPVELDGG